MDVRGLLGRAAASIPAGAESRSGLTKVDVDEYLRGDEWEMALGILADFDGIGRQSIAYWDLLADVAEQLWLGEDAQWCRWRSAETRCGLVIRATLELVAPEAGGRALAIPRAGVLRPMWDIGLPRCAHGGADLHVARIWVESAPEISPGGRGEVRLLPLTPHDWKHLAPGDVITMHERRPTAGTAEIIETCFAGGSIR